MDKTNSEQSYEIMVIGGGTAGLRTALTFANSKKTVLFEPGTLGGTCLNNGCIPTKAMLHSAHLYKTSKNIKEYGIDASNVKLNFKKMMSHVLGIVKVGQKHISKSIKKDNLTLIRKRPRFIGPNTVIVGGKKISAKKIIIATGASNFVPPIKGIDKVKYLDNKKILGLKKLPKSIILIGGGYISIEFATFFLALGVKVTILEASPNVLMMLDSDVRDLLVDIYKKQGINLKTNVKILAIKQNKNHKIALIKDNATERTMEVSADELFVATGRKPNTEELDLKSANVKTGPRGNIIVDNKLVTSNPNIYAIGDVNARAMFAHAAKRESKIVIDNILHNKNKKMNFKFIPWAVFTDPPIAGVGLSESKAEQENIRVGVLKAWFKRVGRANVIGDTDGFVKIIYNKKNGKIVGSVIIGPDADDMIHEIVALLNTSSPYIDVLRKEIHIHPTLSEVMDELKGI